MNVSSINNAFEEKDVLVHENQQLKNQLRGGGGNDSGQNDKIMMLMRENQELKAQINNSSHCT
jgi:hypothetical protein